MGKRLVELLYLCVCVCASIELVQDVIFSAKTRKCRRKEKTERKTRYSSFVVVTFNYSLVALKNMRS